MLDFKNLIFMFHREKVKIIKCTIRFWVWILRIVNSIDGELIKAKN